MPTGQGYQRGTSVQHETLLGLRPYPFAWDFLDSKWSVVRYTGLCPSQQSMSSDPSLSAIYVLPQDENNLLETRAHVNATDAPWHPNY